jgi:membrane associated rhomboid family serine protease
VTAPTPFGDTGPNGLPYCYRHPMRETGVRCIRCNRPICSECMRPAAVGFQCPDDVRSGRIVTRTTVGAPVRQRPIPYVTGALIAANVVVYLVTGFQRPGTLADPRSARLFDDWVMVPFLAAHGHGGGQQLYRLLTSAFLHLDPVHLLSNMVALAFVGYALEPVLGWWRFLSVYLLAAIGGSTCIYLFDTRFVAVAGASGAIFGLFAAALVFARRVGFDMRSLIVIIALNFALTFTIDGISKLGHIGGFVVGGLAALAIGGIPRRAQPTPARVAVLVQSGGLVALAVVLVIAIWLRTAAL